MKNNYQSVFDCNPGSDEIYVVDGMPFLNAAHAQGHSVTTGKPVEVIRRTDKAAADKAAADKAAADKAAADKAAADKTATDKAAKGKGKKK